MYKKRKGRAGRHRPIPERMRSHCPITLRFLMKSAVKRGVMALVVRHLFPRKFAAWIIQQGGLSDA